MRGIRRGTELLKEPGHNMPPNFPWFIDVLRSGDPLRDIEINTPLELTLDIHPDTHPTNPFKFIRSTFNDSPELPADTLHGHPALVFDHCIFKKPLTLTKVKFCRDVIFRSCRFERYVDFTHSGFFHGVSFEDCSFDEKVYFERATFGIDPSEPYEGTVARKSLVGCSICRMWLEVDLELYAKICHPMSCNPEKHDHDSKVCANFSAAVFNDGAEFDYATFHVPACFYKTTWYKATTFLQCQFPLVRDKISDEKNKTSDADIINFSHAQIAGSVEFNQSLRPSKYKDGEISKVCINANFKYIHVHSQHGLRFHTENLKCCSVLGTNLDACHFSNVHWPKVKTHFPLALRKSLTLLGLDPIVIRSVLRFFCLMLSYGAYKALSLLVRFTTRWLVAHRPDDKDYNRSHALKERWQSIREYWRSCWSLEQYGIRDHETQRKIQDKALPWDWEPSVYKSVADLESAVSRWRDQWALLSRAYRDLKTAYEGNKDYIYASDFHYAEKEFRRINYEVPRQIRIQLQLYWLVSGYGERVLRPIWWFLLIWILGAIPYACSDQVTLKPDPPSQQDEQANGRPSSTIS